VRAARRWTGRHLPSILGSLRATRCRPDAPCHVVSAVTDLLCVQAPRDVCLAAADDATRQRCVRVIQAASAGGASSSLFHIASAAALTGELLKMKSLPAVNAVLAALGKAKVKGLDVPSLKAAGFDAAACRAAGYDLSSLKAAGFDAAACRAAGFSWSDLKAAGFTSSNCKAAGCDLPSLKAAGFVAVACGAAGYDLPSLNAAGFDIAADHEDTISFIKIIEEIIEDHELQWREQEENIKAIMRECGTDEKKKERRKPELMTHMREVQRMKKRVADDQKKLDKFMSIKDSLVTSERLAEGFTGGVQATEDDLEELMASFKKFQHKKKKG
jgi:hypothetical protein